MLLCVLLLAHSKANAVTAAVEVFEPVDAFRFLRRLSGLTLRLPEDAPVLSEFFSPEKIKAFSVATDSREITFPRFEEIAEIVDKVRCFALYSQYRSKRIVASMLGKSESAVYRDYKAVANKVKGLRGIL